MPTPLFSTRWAVLVAAAAGLCGLAAFPSYGIWPLAFVSVAGLSLAVHGQRARAGAGVGFVYGLVFCLLLLHWTSTYVGAVPWLLLSFAEAGFFAGLGALLTRLQTMPAAPFWVAAAWVLQEAVRGRFPWGGFPWGRLAFSQAESPLKWFAAVGGAPLVSFVVALAGALLAHALLNRDGARVSAIAGIAALLVPASGLALRPVLEPGSGGRTIVVAAVQGNVPNRGLILADRAREVLENHVRETERLAARITSGEVPQPDLVLWPENASDIDPLVDGEAAALITRAALAVRAPILVGAILEAPGNRTFRNAGILWDPDTGPGAMYTKRHPVPFGEYMPMRALAEAVNPAAKLVGTMLAGEGDGLITGGPVPLGDVICFEIAYDGLGRSAVRAGAQLVVVQTNNATFGESDETFQQLAMSQLRAVEYGRAVVQVATTGKTATIGPDGAIRDQTGDLFTSETIVTALPVHSSSTLAVRIGAAPEWLLVVAALGAGAWSIGVSWRRRVPPRQDEQQAEETVAT